MKILYVTEFFPESSELRFTGGIESLVYHLVKELQTQHHITVLYRPQTTAPQFPPAIKNVNLLACGPVSHQAAASLGSLWGRGWYILDCLRKGLAVECDLVIGTNFVSYLPAFIISKIKRVPVLSVYADVFIGRWTKLFTLPLAIIGEITERLVLLLPWDGYLPISHSTGKLLKNVGVKSEKIFPSPLGVDLKQFQKSNVHRSGSPNILTIAWLLPYKRLQDLLQALQLLKLQYKITNITCIIVGEGPFKKQLLQLTEKLKLNRNVTFMSKVERVQLIKLLKQSKIFCLPSEVEGFGLVTLEALACGTPYVNSDIQVTREITHHGKGGLLFPVGDYQDLAAKLYLLLTDKILYQNKQKQGRDLVKNFDWPLVAKRTAGIYSKVIKNANYENSFTN